MFFQNTSMTGAGMIVFAIVALFSHFNIAGIDENQISSFVSAAIQVVSFVVMVIGQLRRKDLTVGMVRKQPRP